MNPVIDMLWRIEHSNPKIDSGGRRVYCFCPFSKIFLPYYEKMGVEGMLYSNDMFCDGNKKYFHQVVGFKNHCKNRECWFHKFVVDYFVALHEIKPDKYDQVIKPIPDHTVTLKGYKDNHGKKRNSSGESRNFSKYNVRG